MSEEQQGAASMLDFNFRRGAVAIALAVLLVATIIAVPAAQAQSFTILHTFTGYGDGGEPLAGLTMDRAGNLYGTTSQGGEAEFGTVFRLVHAKSGWVLYTLYSFQGGQDGANPQARVLFGPDGTLYGTTAYGGDAGSGTVFNLRPPATSCRAAQCPWIETVLYRFTGGSDGGEPGFGELAFDLAGNIYGTTSYGGMGCHAYGGCGVVFELTRSGGGWTESVLYRFTGGSDGFSPFSGVTFDRAGNLYGTTVLGGSDEGGTLYQLIASGSGWTETTLHSFGASGDGSSPYGGLIIDQQGNLYGTTFYNGIVYQLQSFGSNWKYNILYVLGGQGPYDAPTMDAAGNLYGTTFGGGFVGNVFKLTPGAGGWTYTDLHDFNGRDGVEPVGGVVLDPSGNIYGTTFYDFGEVWEIMP
jgi:uncharacterized repeat protein (TIGR03803 family)